MSYERFEKTPENDSKIESKLLIWQELINDADVANDTKNKFLEVLSRFKDWANHYPTLYDAVYYTVSQLFGIYKKDTNKKEAEALFDNIRDDLWALVREK